MRAEIVLLLMMEGEQAMRKDRDKTSQNSTMLPLLMKDLVLED